MDKSHPPAGGWDLSFDILSPKVFKINMSGESSRSNLSDRAILRHMDEGNIFISPFNRQSLNTTSYDVKLGKWFWREQYPESGGPHSRRVYNPWSKNDVQRIWGDNPYCAELAGDWMRKYGFLENIYEDNQLIWIEPGETILCHTEEFIGGRGGIVTTMMKARSGMGRSFIEVCKCAGWGDVGFTNRWTMEVTNNSRYYSIPLVVGRRIAQIVFFEVEPILDSDYTETGKYQNSDDMEKVMKDWNPTNMLPKMYKDREARR